VDGTDRARRFRREMSPPEAALWQYLRTRPGGFKFRRQHRMDPYTLDFYCRAAAVCIEVDGDAHDMGDRPLRDARRDAWLSRRGILTLRFLAADVLSIWMRWRRRSKAFVGRGRRPPRVEGPPPPPFGRSPPREISGRRQGAVFTSPPVDPYPSRGYRPPRPRSRKRSWSGQELERCRCVARARKPWLPWCFAFFAWR
jgi:very-short-patch-repair endonuclease